MDLQLFCIMKGKVLKIFVINFIVPSPKNLNSKTTLMKIIFVIIYYIFICLVLWFGDHLLNMCLKKLEKITNLRMKTLCRLWKKYKYNMSSTYFKFNNNNKIRYFFVIIYTTTVSNYFLGFQLSEFIVLRQMPLYKNILHHSSLNQNNMLNCLISDISYHNFYLCLHY